MDKNAVDVADRIVDIGEKVVNAIVKRAPDVWDGLVAYHRTEAIGDLVASLLLIVLSVLIVVPCFKVMKQYATTHFSNREEEVSLLIAVGAFIGALAFLIVGCCHVVDMPKHIANVAFPERAAALDVINSVK